MNDEIKEILDKIKEIYDIHEQIIIKHNNADEIKFFLSIKEGKLLLDYITNLQQELKYQEEAEIEYNEKHTKLMEEYKRLKEENERLKLEIERLNDVLVHKPDEKIMLKTNDGKELFIIQSERIDMQEELNKANMQLMTQLEDYKSRCEKALKLAESYELGKYDYSILPGGIIELKDILNGDK